MSKCETCGAAVPEGYRACPGLSTCWEEVWKKDQASRPTYEKYVYVVVGICSVCGKEGQTPWMDEGKPICVACLGKQRDAARIALDDADAWRQRFIPEANTAADKIATVTRERDLARARLAEVEAQNSALVAEVQALAQHNADEANAATATIAEVTAQAGAMREALTPLSQWVRKDLDDHVVVAWLGDYDHVSPFEIVEAANRARAALSLDAGRAYAAEHEALRAWVQELTVDGCSYGDGCPSDTGTRHGTCLSCKARNFLASLDSVPK